MSKTDTKIDSNLLDRSKIHEMAEKLYLEGLNLPAAETIELLKTHVAHNYGLLSDDPVIRAEGAWLYTRKGKKIFDGVAAYSAANLGHNHPLVSEMLLHFLSHQSPTVLGRFMPDPFLALFGKKITEMTGFDSFLPANGGVEAPEAAIKLARRWGHNIKKVSGTPEIIYFTGCFHGRTLTVTQMLSEDVALDGFEPYAPGFIKIQFGDIEALKNAVNENTIAILIEPIQGEGGINIPPDGYLCELQNFAKENNVLVIYDEVQTGWGRTGKLFAWEHDGEKYRPDIMCVGKSVSAGFAPVSGILAGKELMNLFEPGSHGSTFGGCPISSAIAYAALNAIEMEKLPSQASEKGKYVMSELEKIASESRHIEEIRGKGLMIGIELKKDGPDGHHFSVKFLEKGMIIKDTHEWVLRFTPPIVASKKDLDFALGLMREAFTGDE